MTRSREATTTKCNIQTVKVALQEQRIQFSPWRKSKKSSHNVFNKKATKGPPLWGTTKLSCIGCSFSRHVWRGDKLADHHAAHSSSIADWWADHILCGRKRRSSKMTTTWWLSSWRASLARAIWRLGFFSKNFMGTEIWGPAKGCSSVGGDEELAGRFTTWCSGMQVGATMQEEFRVLPCRWKSKVWP
jgi:hypothetical protein